MYNGENYEEKSEIIYYDNKNGDSSILRIYDKIRGRYTSILFDMGQKNQGIMMDIISNKVELTGIVVTHVDQDHIWGIIELLNYEEFYKNNKLEFIVFNTFNKSLISYKQGNQLTEIINNKYENVLLINSYSKNYDIYNKKLDSKVRFLSLEKRDLYGDLGSNDYILITFLTPDSDDLRKLMVEWRKDNEYNEGKSDEKGKTQDITNRSSISCLIEYNNLKVLMTGDHYINYIYTILLEKKAIWDLERIHCIKMPHHGSKKNNDGLLELVKEYQCENVYYMSYNNEKSNRKFLETLEEDMYKIGVTLHKAKELLKDGYLKRGEIKLEKKSK